MLAKLACRILLITQLIVPDDGISAGTVFGYDTDASLLYGDSWQVQDAGFALAAAGDTILLYCQSDSGEIVHLGGLSYSGMWAADGMSGSDYGTSSSALPSALVGVGPVALPHFDNYMYNGSRTGSKIALQKSLMTTNNWMGSNSARYSVSTIAPFVVEGKSNTSLAPKILDCSSLMRLLVLLMAMPLSVL